MDPLELPAPNFHIPLDPRADREHHGVKAVAQLLDAEINADLDSASKLDALVGEQVGAAIDDPLLQLRVRDTEAEQPAEPFVALEHGDRVPNLVELVGRRQARGPRTHDRDLATGAVVGWVRRDPTLLERMVDRPVLDLLDHHRVVVDRQHARGLARGRADQTRELGKVVGRVQLIDRLAPIAGAGQIVPIGDQVAERTCVVTERHPAVHAARGLLAELILGQRLVDLAVVADALGRVPLGRRHPVHLEETARVGHQAAAASLLELETCCSRSSAMRAIASL